MSGGLERPADSSFGRDLCPRCEEGILVRVEVPHDVALAGSVVRIPRVQAEECRRCGFRALSGREVRLFEVLFAPHYETIADLVAALRAAHYTGMFLREDLAETGFGFASRSYVEGLSRDLVDLYLDNETSHVLSALDHPEGVVPLDVAGRKYRIRLPKVGEGENGIVFDHEGDQRTVFKVAKPRPYSRDHVRQECELTDTFLSAGIAVPRIADSDPYGSYVVKERLSGRSVAVLYDELGGPGAARHRRVREAVRAFVFRLLDLFARQPATKTSVSPNNIFVVEEDGRCDCLLVDTGPAPFHDYSRFDFDEYWDVVVPEKIRRYREVGYI
ncbi:hypothetical protein FBQ97_05070 [Acidobacteria bacterium ACD]|nr:MAG: hypothetical protein EDX89_01150 [Acidobacteriota bacterium]MCE7958755.1 hypothetical protein [Acidobacteria bacterium ACB2]MDL1949171.1 hypothetical protein [Acidobacteria bacterium ACD]